MGKKNNKYVTLEKLFKRGLIALIVFFSVLLLDIAILLPIAIVAKSIPVFLALMISVILILIALLVVVFDFSFNLRKITLEQLYKNTLKNYNALKDSKNELNDYEDVRHVVDFSEFNKCIDEIRKNTQQSIVYSKNVDYEEMGFSFLDNEHLLVSYDSFAEHYKKILFNFNGYGCAFISYIYPPKEEGLDEEEISKFVNCVRNIFAYSRILIAFNSKNSEFIVVVPNYDTIDRLKEEIKLSFEAISIVRYSQDGHNLVSPKASIVLFPHSEVDNILSDIQYANRQNETLNIYIPENIKKENSFYLQNNLNKNYFAHLFESLTNPNSLTNNLNDAQSQLNKVLNDFASYYNFDSATISRLNESGEAFENIVEYKSHNLRGKVQNIEPNLEFVKAVERHMDENFCYYFSNRGHASNSIGVFIDSFCFQSGFIRLIKYDNEVVGIIMLTKLTPSTLDFTSRNNLVLFSQFVDNYLISLITSEELSSRNNKITNLLKITDYKTYTVNRRNHEIISFSETLKDTIRNIEVGCKCYEALYGLEKPCSNCPLSTHRKMYQNLNDVRHESSLVLSRPRSKNAEMLLTPSLKDGLMVRERFDSDLFTNTYFSFIEFMRDSFVTTQRGYVVVANIDNISDIQKIIPNEMFNAYLRGFFEDIEKNIPLIENIYFIPNNSFAFVLPKGRHKEIIDSIEKIYILSKKVFTYKKNHVSLNLTYFAHSYPFGYQNSDEFVRFLLNDSKTSPQQMNKDLIVMNENDYIRPASHILFVNDVIDKTLSKNTFDIKLQPVVKKDNRRIIGAEILLRVSDSFLNQELNTVEIIKSSVESGKIGLLTDGVIEQLGNLYHDYSSKLFSKYSVNQLSLNTDYSFFQDINFVEKIKNLEEKYSFPKGFITFEIQESEIAAHYQEFSSIVKTIAKNDIKMTCDNYTGKSLSLAKIKELGFTEIKTDRSVVNKLLTDESAIEGIKAMMENADKLGIKCTIVGVEFKEQYNLLKNVPFNYQLQGYYFYRPLDVTELLNSLMTANA